MFSDGMEPGWKPEPPPEHGSHQWMENIALSWCIDHDMTKQKTPSQRCRVVKLPAYDGVELGYMMFYYGSGGGYDYVRIDGIEGGE